MRVREAEDFLVHKTLEQASLEKIPLCDLAHDAFRRRCRNVGGSDRTKRCLRGRIRPCGIRLASMPPRHDQNEGLISQFKYVFLGLAILVYVASVFSRVSLGELGTG